jgi:hypothetical protein
MTALTCAQLVELATSFLDQFRQTIRVLGVHDADPRTVPARPVP